MNGKDTLHNRLVTAMATVQRLLAEIYRIEADAQTPAIERLSQIKKIREELTKVNVEIDNVKNEIKLINSYSVN